MDSTFEAFKKDNEAFMKDPYGYVDALHLEPFEVALPSDRFPDADPIVIDGHFLADIYQKAVSSFTEAVQKDMEFIDKSVVLKEVLERLNDSLYTDLEESYVDLEIMDYDSESEVRSSLLESVDSYTFFSTSAVIDEFVDSPCMNRIHELQITLEPGYEKQMELLCKGIDPLPDPLSDTVACFEPERLKAINQGFYSMLHSAPYIVHEGFSTKSSDHYLDRMKTFIENTRNGISQLENRYFVTSKAHQTMPLDESVAYLLADFSKNEKDSIQDLAKDLSVLKDLLPKFEHVANSVAYPVVVKDRKKLLNGYEEVFKEGLDIFTTEFFRKPCLGFCQQIKGEREKQRAQSR